jgi:hypothetical protein
MNQRGILELQTEFFNPQVKNGRNTGLFRKGTDVLKNPKDLFAFVLISFYIQPYG